MAKYMELADFLRQQIETGKLKTGDKIPSISQLVEHHRMSYGSVRGAMLVLKAEGILEGRQGDGVFVL